MRELKYIIINIDFKVCVLEILVGLLEVNLESDS